MSSTTTWTEHDLTSGANTLHYARMGVRSGPPVVLLHGFSDAGLCWHRFASDIASEYDVILPDAAGHGRTSPPAPGEQQARGVADVLAVLDALGFNQVALVGHSMGAGTAARVAVAAPERVRALALEDPGWARRDLDAACGRAPQPCTAAQPRMDRVDAQPEGHDPRTATGGG